jgi:hypothetical protein
VPLLAQNLKIEARNRTGVRDRGQIEEALALLDDALLIVEKDRGALVWSGAEQA